MPSLTDLAKMTKRRLFRKRRKVVDPIVKSPYMLDEQLESAAAPNQPVLHPTARGIMKGSGLLSAIRNRSNQNVVDPEADL